MDVGAERGDVEFVHEVCGLLPSQVIGELMGLPRDDWSRIHRWAERNTSGQDPDHVRDGAAAGTPREVVERILEFGREGAETVYLQYHTLDESDHLDLIGEEVLPNVGSGS